MIVTSPLQASPSPVGDIPTFVFRAAEQHKNEVVLIDAATEQRFTISDIYTTATMLAAGLACGGYGGKTISVFDNTELRCIYVYYAALMAGGAYQSLDIDTPPDRLRERIAHSQTPIVFTTTPHLLRLQDAVKDLGIAIAVLDQGCDSSYKPTTGSDIGLKCTCLSFSHLLVDDPSFSPVRITSTNDAMAKPAYLTYASGVQATLQPLVLSHFGLLSSYPIGRPRFGCGIDSACKTAVSAVPFADSHGIVSIAHFPILSGSCIVQMSSYDPASCLAALERWRAGVFLTTHAVLAAIVAAAERGKDGSVSLGGARSFDIGQLQLVFVHELRDAHALRRKAAEVLGARLVELYGYIETGIIAGLITEHPRIEGSVGLLCSNIRARVVFEGKELDEGQFGEILVSTPRFASGRPQADIEYFHTGDYGTVTSEGVVIIKARMNGLIHLHDGSIVAPCDIEKQVLQLPGVADCAVIASQCQAENDKFDVPYVFIVPSENIGNISSISIQSLAATYPGIQSGITSFIPRSTRGEPDRCMLQRLLKQTNK
ncbi:4-coumarate--CoA ligase-like 5 [Coemansia sp. RSA 988]|nr:4-coumarate--CoA ligase-like 5 [Coemansia sp. RSA 988]